MRYVQLGSLRVSAVGLGTWQFGSRGWGWGRELGPAEAERIVHHALDLGINLFDTAEMYGGGLSEEVLGRALAGRRHEAVIATKVSPQHLTYRGVLGSARKSLKRLGTDHVDLYQVHWPNPFLPLSRTMRAMRRLVEEGLVREVGVCNFGLGRWRRAEALLGRPVVSDQVSFSLTNRRPLRQLVPHARQRGRVVIAYSPLAQGLLTGRYGPENAPRGVRTFNPLFLPQNLRRLRPLLDTLQQVAKRHNATPGQVALAWLLHLPNVVVIPGAKSVEQVEANARSADIALTDEEWQALHDSAVRARPLPLPLAVPLMALRLLLP